MGQYYRAIVKKQNGRIDVYNRNVVKNGKSEYTFAKLTEHSWWYNDFVNAVCLDIYDHKERNRIAWIGDYATDFLKCRGLKTFNGMDGRKIRRLAERCWNCDGKDVNETDFALDGLYLINHTKQEFINCTTYRLNSEMGDKWCLHPLPIMTCIGNGLGGGDYCDPTDDSTEEYIGCWAWDQISIENQPPTTYTEIEPIFKEKNWN